MSILDSILEDRRRREAASTADLAMIPQALNSFIAGRQQARNNYIDEIKVQADLASKGFRIDPQTGDLVRDPSLSSPTDLLIQYGKIADAQLKMAQAGMGGMLQQFGLQPPPVPNQGVPQTTPQVPPADDNIVLEKNALGVPTKTISKTGMLAQQRLENDIAMELEKQKKAMEGVGSGESGKVTLAKLSIKDIEDVKKSLFPDGTPESFNRELAASSNLPGLEAFGKRITPQVRPDNPFDPTDQKITEEAQNVFRKIGSSLAARQLIQTGVTVRPDETAKLVAQFAPNYFSNPKSALKGLDELQNFYKEYIKTIDPEGVKLKGTKESSNIFSNMDEAEKSNVPVGSIVTIGGKKYRKT